MREKLVYREHENLYDEEEWLDHAPSDWTVIGGELCYWGQPWNGPGRKARLRPIPEPPLPLDRVLGAIVRGLRTAQSVAASLGIEEAVAARALEKLERQHLVDSGRRDGEMWYRPRPGA